MPGPQAPARARIPLLARLKVGTKLMLLVLVPVCALLGFTILTAVADWRAPSSTTPSYPFAATDVIRSTYFGAPPL